MKPQNMFLAVGRIVAQEILQRDSFRYLISIITKDWEINKDVEHKMGAR